MNNKTGRNSGFTTVELATVCMLFLVLSGMGALSLQSSLQAYGAGSDARMIASQISQARMRAAATFTRVRLNTDTVNRTYQVEVMTDKTAGTYQLDGGTGVLSQGVTFGFASVSTPAGEQTTIEQSPTIIFNSRGIPIQAADGAPTSGYALYLTNGNGLVYAVTVGMSGHVITWQYLGSAWVRI